MNYAIFSYSSFDINSLEVNDFIFEKQNRFLEEIQLEVEKGSTYHTFYDTSMYQDIISVHLVLFVYSGGAHDIRFDRVYYYDIKNHKEILLKDILEYNESLLNELSTLSKEFLLEKKQDVIFDEEDILEEGLEATFNRFQYLMFEEENLKIIFPPYQVGPWSSGEIDVLIPYFKIEKYLKIC